MESDAFCMAPWTHTYLSPQLERRLCCASREPAQNFQQYIDTKGGTGEFHPLTLEEHWNSDRMRSVRRQMMNGVSPPECEVCSNKLLNTSVYRDYFTHLFAHKKTEALASTTPDGSTTMRPVSWDYRFSNLCNFKCRMCGDMLSSAWETEQRKHNMTDWDNPKNQWMKPEIRHQISQFQDTQIESEFSKAVDNHQVEEVYWVGGEPLMYEQHWRYMKRIIDLGDGQNVYARYNTNLSRVEYNGVNLYRDILAHIRDWQICASIDGTGDIGEYIRTGLDYQSWLNNFKEGLSYAKHPRQMRLDFTLTLPGMFEVVNIMNLSRELNVEVLSKVVFSFTPDIVMSPLALPSDLLHPWIDEILPSTDGAMRDVLQQLKTRPTFDQEWATTYKDGLKKGKERILKVESIRSQTTTFEKILSQRPRILEWWNDI
jgi:hypothetical protein